MEMAHYMRGGVTSAYHMLNYCPVSKTTGTCSAKRQNTRNWMEIKEMWLRRVI